MLRFLIPVLGALCLAGAAAAEDVGRALVRGDARAAAAELAVELRAALARSSERLSIDDIEVLEAQLREDLAEAAALAQDRRLRWRAAFDVSWRRDAAPDEQGRACGGYVDVGAARVTATSTSRAATPGLSRLSCTLATQSEDGFGWIGFSAISPGEGALALRFSVESRDAAVRQAAAEPMSRALQRIVAAIRPAAAQRHAPRPRTPGTET